MRLTPSEASKTELSQLPASTGKESAKGDTCGKSVCPERVLGLGVTSSGGLQRDPHHGLQGSLGFSCPTSPSPGKLMFQHALYHQLAFAHSAWKYASLFPILLCVVNTIHPLDLYFLSFIFHSLTQKIFSESLPCARHWGYNSEKDKRGTCPHRAHG